jgi:hypothetical protein
MTMTETTTRSVLTLTIKDAAAANAVALKAQEAVTAASTVLSQAERDLAAARAALEGARGVQRPLAALLAETTSDAEREELVDAYNKPRPTITAEDLRDARALVLDSEDRVVVARSELERLQSAATSATAAANRANDRRQQAIYAVVRPEVARLMDTAEKLTRELGEARLSLRFVGANFVNEYGDERRQISRMLDLDLGSMFPEEFGFRAEPSAALASWRAFAEAIARNSAEPFPDAPLN